MIVNKYKEAIDEFRTLIEGGEDPNVDEVFETVQSMKKVSIFYSCHNMNPWDIWDSLFMDINDVKKEKRNLSDEAVKYCISACFFSILWGQQHITESCESGSKQGEDECLILRKRLDDLMSVMCFLVEGDKNMKVNYSYLRTSDL